ncbi:MAG: T9SS type A sorting domain-containing protein [Bacteroidetes bacterium]|nr:T9SS type A sorting domain-containing protein [Bacteroidota bacterium]MDA0902729.1 T9SS type A sorting domain-containing protein [Bacteroidota bacterium]MDA1241810.1 T9SS type A sorting domain-containing protein [Bacteroidota bacterium]
MKNMRKLALVFWALGMLISMQGFSQCVIDHDFGDLTFGVSPDPAAGETFLDGMLGVDYYDVLHILIPTTAADIDTTFPPTLPVDSVVVLPNTVDGDGVYSGVVFTDTLTNEEFFADEIGLEWIYNNNGDSGNPMGFLGGEQYCGSLQGVPTRSGIYRIRIDVLGWATIFSPFNAPYSFENFTLRINCPLIDDVEIVNANSVTGVDGQLTVVLSEGVLATEIAWFNQYGVQIGTGETVTVDNPGTFAVQVTTEDCVSMFNGWVVIDEGLDCVLTATVEVSPAVTGISLGSAVLTVGNESGAVSATWYSANNLIVGTGLQLNGMAPGTYSVVVSDDSGCTVEITDIVVDEVSSIQSVEAGQNVLFPNPCMDSFRINVQTTAFVEIRAMNGSVVFKGTVLPGEAVDMTHVAPGVYLASWQSGELWEQAKLMVAQ